MLKKLGVKSKTFWYNLTDKFDWISLSSDIRNGNHKYIKFIVENKVKTFIMFNEIKMLIVDSIRENNENGFHYLLKYYCNTYGVDEGLNYFLENTIIYNRFSMLKTLFELENFIDKIKYTNTMLKFLVNNIDMMKICPNLSEMDKYELVKYSIKFNKVDTLKYLLESTFTINSYYSKVLKELSKDNKEIYHLLLNDKRFQEELSFNEYELITKTRS